ncbi:MAG UNVERIFIED_CONTAM: hypothetical protein LVR29_11995 [Microcystis novacekii LVE1205-3]
MAIKIVRDLSYNSIIGANPAVVRADSINFLHGTEQGLHEDMAVFHVHPANHLVGCLDCLGQIFPLDACR